MQRITFGDYIEAIKQQKQNKQKIFKSLTHIKFI